MIIEKNVKYRDLKIDKKKLFPVVFYKNVKKRPNTRYNASQKLITFFKFFYQITRKNPVITRNNALF